MYTRSLFHYSKAFAIMYRASFPWLKNGENPRHTCPDGENSVIFELERIE